MTGGELTAAQIRALLHELGRRLKAAGAHGDVKLIGAAALILQGIGNRPTANIDASYADPLRVRSSKRIRFVISSPQSLCMNE